jgi:hypothetical protein
LIHQAFSSLSKEWNQFDPSDLLIINQRIFLFLDCQIHILVSDFATIAFGILSSLVVEAGALKGLVFVRSSPHFKWQACFGGVDLQSKGVLKIGGTNFFHQTF